MMTVADDAKLVKAYLLEHGWVPRGQSIDDEDGSPCCVSTAAGIVIEMIDPDKFDSRCQRFHDAMKAAGGYLDSLPHWNDRQTSVEPVLALLDKVIAGGGDE